jgi:hypothetical protein
MRARLPHCSQTQTFEAQVCRAWDLNLAWPHLTKAKIVPPELVPNRVTLEVPTTSVRVVSGIGTQCQTQERVCTRLQGNATINIDTGNPLATLRSVAQGQCAQTATVGCS